MAQNTDSTLHGLASVKFVSSLAQTGITTAALTVEIRKLPTEFHKETGDLIFLLYLAIAVVTMAIVAFMLLV